MSGIKSSQLDRDAKKLMLLVLVPVTLLFFMLGYVLQQQRQQSQIDSLNSQQIRDLAEARASLLTSLELPIQHLTGTVANPFVLQAMTSDNPNDRNRALAASLSGIALRNSGYMQLRWIVPNGNEALRINVDDQTGNIEQLPPAVLQNKAERPYHRQSMQLAPLTIAISPPDLNVEFGVLERPLRPTIRYSLRLPEVNDVDLGYLIFNLDLAPLMAPFNQTGQDNRIYLADTQGQWIRHENAAQTWGQLLNQATLISDTNPELWDALNTQSGPDSSGFTQLPSGLWRWSPIVVGADNETVAQQSRLWVIGHIPQANLATALSNSLGRSLWLFIMLAVALAIFTAVLYQTQRRATALRQANQSITQELDASLTFQQTLNNVLPALVIYWDRREECQYVNATFDRWFEMPGSELVGRSYRNVSTREEYEEFHPLLERAMKGETLNFERSVSHLGVERHLQTTYVPHRQTDPADPERTLVSGVISISADLTDIIQARRDVEALNQALAERTRQAENTAAAKSHFLANMSHEIRTPMNAIIGLLDIIRDTPLDQKQTDYIDNARSSARSLLHILNDILDLSKLEAGKLTIQMESFDVERLFKNTASLFDIAFQKKGIELLVWVDPRIPPQLKGDPHRLNQVINNLVGNALKFTRQGQVVLAVSLADKSDHSAQLTYSVKDSGIGIPADKQQSIFEYFNQADNATSREFGGTGLGLSICRTLVHMMHGQIGVRSSEGVGSEFHFELSHAIVDDSHPAAPGLQRVLVIDSSMAALHMTRDYLESWNIEAVSATGLSPGLAYYHAQGMHYDAVLVEYQLEDGDGLMFLDAIKNDEKPAPLVVMLTRQDPYNLLAALQEKGYGGTPILKKPLTPSALYDVLARLSHNAPKHPQHSPGAGESELQAQARALSSKRILMVEDNTLNQEIAQTLLGNLGVPLEVCDGGAEALQLLQNNHYDAVLMDLHMPEMDGYETTRRIREQWGTDLPVIALSAAVMEDDIAQAKGAGMDDHVAKPIDLVRLVDTLSQWVLPKQERRPKAIADATIDTVSAELQHLFQQMHEDAVSAVQRFQGDEDALRKLLLGFQRNYGDYQRQLIDAAETGHGDLPRLLHTLKGTAGNLGLGTLSAEAAAAETRLKQDGAVDLTPLTQQLTLTLTALDELDSLSAAEPQRPVEDESALLATLEEILARSRVVSTELLHQLNSLAAHILAGERLPRADQRHRSL